MRIRGESSAGPKMENVGQAPSFQGEAYDLVVNWILKFKTGAKFVGEFLVVFRTQTAKFPLDADSRNRGNLPCFDAGFYCELRNCKLFIFIVN